MMWRRPPAAQAAPQRRPHPDPGRELQLQRILDLRAAIGRQAELITVYRNEIGLMHYAARGEADVKLAGMYLQQAGVLHDRITETETAICAVLALRELKADRAAVRAAAIRRAGGHP